MHDLRLEEMFSLLQFFRKLMHHLITCITWRYPEHLISKSKAASFKFLSHLFCGDGAIWRIIICSCGESKDIVPNSRAIKKLSLKNKINLI